MSPNFPNRKTDLFLGDLGYMNEEGYLWITDRLKELIKYKGNQVPPAQLEAVILTHPSVEDCAVIGIPDESAGELPRAYVKVKESFEGKVTEGELQAFVKGYKLQIRQNIFSIRFEIKKFMSLSIYFMEYNFKSCVFLACVPLRNCFMLAQKAPLQNF